MAKQGGLGLRGQALREGHEGALVRAAGLLAGHEFAAGRRVLARLAAHGDHVRPRVRAITLACTHVTVWEMSVVDEG